MQGRIAPSEKIRQELIKGLMSEANPPTRSVRSGQPGGNLVLLLPERKGGF